MWSGPRNISTALMRSWGNRPDTFVCDEPLYAHYLKVTRRAHPGSDEVIARHETDWRKMVAWLTEATPAGKPIFYQKQMSHHLLLGIDRGWLSHVTNCFLIRNPREMLTSLVKFVPDPLIDDTGLPQQVEIFRLAIKNGGAVPPVIDAKDVLEDPRGMLKRLCDALGVPFLESMFTWPPGRRETDGVWAKHWYADVENSTSFRPYIPKAEPVPARFADLLEVCLAYYDELYEHRLRPGE
jgi:hypothetical protein